MDSFPIGTVDLARILGIFLDNAIEAALETRNPQIGLNIIRNKTGIAIIISNRFQDNGVVLHRLKQKGFSTKTGQNTGIYFLDIDLNSSMNGMKLAQQIRLFDPRGFIIFITAHSELSYMTFQYRVEAMDFVLKDNPAEAKVKISIDYDDILFFETSSKSFSMQRTVKLNFPAP